MRVALFLCCIAALVPPTSRACDAQSAAGRAATPPQPSIRDSSGLEIVELSGDMLNGLPLWQFAGQPALSIGVADGDAPYLFSNVIAARRLSTGEIVVIDGASRELRVFAADGRFVRKSGGQGQGPGEFGSPTLFVSEMNGTTLSVFDYSRNTITTINVADGKFTMSAVPRRCRVSGTATLDYCGTVRPLADGTAFRSWGSSSSVDGGANLTITRGGTVPFGLARGDTLWVVDSVTGSSQYSKGIGDA